jgi:poly(A) polymerase
LAQFMLKDAATEIVRTLRQRRHQAYLVGGCVRDLLLGREPADYDVATDAKPGEVMSIFPDTYAVGAQFGVVLVPVDCSRPPDSAKRSYIEVATFRSDGLYSDGRHPDKVIFSADPKKDAQRRDFTINGLLLDPLKNDEVLDFVGGRADLKAGIIRTIGEPHRRFAEDKLRMLRAVRFAARFGYKVDAETMSAIRELAVKIHHVSRERIREELLKMLTEGAARRAFELLDESGLLAQVLPEISKTKGVEQPPQFHPEGDVWVHTLLLLEQLPAGASPTLALGALLHDVGKPPTFRAAPDRIRFDSHAEVGATMAEDICSRLRLSSGDSAKVTDLVADHMRFGEVKNMRDSTFKRFVRTPDFGELLELHRMDCLASHRDLSLYEFVRHRLASMPREEIRPQPLVTGDDLIAAGYPPGPDFKAMLAASEDAQLEGRIKTKSEGLALIAKEFPQRRSS